MSRVVYCVHLAATHLFWHLCLQALLAAEVRCLEERGVLSGTACFEPAPTSPTVPAVPPRSHCWDLVFCAGASLHVLVAGAHATHAYVSDLRSTVAIFGLELGAACPRSLRTFGLRRRGLLMLARTAGWTGRTFGGVLGSSQRSTQTLVETPVWSVASS